MSEAVEAPVYPDPDWSLWQPTETAVLCFVVRDGQILLIEKKRGLGAGKVNGPGGRIEPGETPFQAALRETEEEVGVIPSGVREAGILCFQFTNGYALHCTAFRADSFEGELIETDEANPFWAPVGRIPFERMWADDIHWMEHLLSGQNFEGFFVFDEDKMLSHRIQLKQQA